MQFCLFDNVALKNALLVCLLLLQGSCDETEDVVTVHVHQGKLTGRKMKTVNHEATFYSFQGIPYAEPPIGELRFMPPKPLAKWEGILNATNDGIRCPQEDPLFDRFPSGSEDCLVLNVYTPSIYHGSQIRRIKLPVMFWIHGGGFASGSSNPDLFGPDFIVNEDVILVTANYRLGALGFMNLEDDTVTGNMGLKDIVLALRWVQDNINVFNGDKDKVTIFGNNAGAAAVSLLLHSPLATGTFHRAICQSGVFELPQLFSPNPRMRAFNLAKILNKNPDNSAELLKDLRKANVNDIVKSSPRTFDSTEVRDSQKSILPFGPSVENVTVKDGAFLTASPDLLYSKNFPNPDVPLMLGFNSREAIVFLKTLINDPEILEKLNYNFQFSIPLRGLEFEYNSADYKDVARRIKQFYFKNGVITNKSMNEFVDYVSDGIFYPIHKTLTKHLAASYADTYLYRFSFDGSLNFFKNAVLKDTKSIEGASNGDEICYLFKCGVLKDAYTEMFESIFQPEEVIVSERMARLWTNFAKFGNPTPPHDNVLHDFTWTPVTRSEYSFLDIDTKLTMDSDPGYLNIKFWDEIFSQYSKDNFIKTEL